MFQSYKFRSKIGVKLKNRHIGIDYARRLSENRKKRSNEGYGRILCSLGKWQYRILGQPPSGV